MGCRYRKNFQENVERPSREFLAHLQSCATCSKEIQIAITVRDALDNSELIRSRKDSPTCPSEDELMSFVDAMLPEDRYEPVLEHLSACTGCRQEVYSLVEMHLDTVDIPLLEHKSEKSIFERIISWLEPVLTPRLSPVPVTAYSLLILLTVAVVWNVVNPVTSYDPEYIRIALEKNRHTIYSTIDPESRLLQLKTGMETSGKIALGIVNSTESQLDISVGAAIYLETLNELLQLPKIPVGKKNEVIVQALKKLAVYTGRSNLLTNYTSRIEEAALRFAGGLGEDKELAVLIKQIERKVESNSQVNLFFNLGSYYYLTCRSTFDLASDDNLKSLMQLAKQFETAVVNHNTKFDSQSDSGEVMKFLEAAKSAKESSNPTTELETSCHRLFEKY